MNGRDRSGIANATPGLPPACEALLASLRASGADKFDPAGWHYLEVLAARAPTYRGRVGRLLDTKLEQKLVVFNERFALARREAEECLSRHARRHPHAADELHRLFDAADFKGLRRFAATLEAGAPAASLADLVRRLEPPVPDNTALHVEKHAGTRAELKIVRRFGNTLSTLSVRKQVNRAFEQAPKNAGPINSHMLVLRSLALMRDVSPDYLNRFMSYADTLLRLDEWEKEKLVSPRKPPKTRAAKK